MAEGDRRPPLTRERVVAEALTVIAQEGVMALTMRSLAARLGVVPGALYRHVRNKEQLQDLVLDAVPEAFLEPLQAAGFDEHQAGLAFNLIADYATDIPARRESIPISEVRLRR